MSEVAGGPVVHLDARQVSASAEGVELARDSVRLLVVEGDLRECRPDDEGCG